MRTRGGRRGFDTIGHVVACQSPFEGPEEAFDLVTSPPDNLRSQFSISYGMVLNLVRAGRPLPMVRSIVEQSFGNYLGGKAKREQTKELRRLKQQADALREQIEMGESIVPREEWRRYVKLEERLKEERRLMKIISRQSWDMKAEMARAAIRDFLEIDEGIALALVELDDVAEDGRVIRPGRNLPPSFSRGARPKSTTIGLMPDGSWSVEDPDAAEDDVADGEDDVASADSSNAVTPRTADAADAVAAFDDADSDESPHATPSSSSSTSSAFSRPARARRARRRRGRDRRGFGRRRRLYRRRPRRRVVIGSARNARGGCSTNRSCSPRTWTRGRRERRRCGRRSRGAGSGTDCGGRKGTRTRSRRRRRRGSRARMTIQIPTTTNQVRPIHWFPYDRVGVVNTDP